VFPKPSQRAQAALRFLAQFLGVCALMCLVLVLTARLLRPQLPKAPVNHAAADLAAQVEKMETRFDTENPPDLVRDVDYAQPGGNWFPKGESPILRELVNEGKLPGVAERVGHEPLVMEGVEGIGKYGGTWVRYASTQSDIDVITWRMNPTGLLRWSPMGFPVRPNVAKSFEHTPDFKTWTFHLRQGMKWSDGHAFDADAIMYWWEEDLYLNTSRPEWMFAGGTAGEIRKVDDYTVQFVFNAPYPTFAQEMVRPAPYSPRHYMEQFHPRDGNQELIKAMMKSRGITTARALYNTMRNYKNVDLPRISPWIYRTAKASPPESFVRNPYYWAVDSQGNQLPYLDRILFDVKSVKLIPVAVADGAATMQERNLVFDDYTMLMENQVKNKYQVYHWFQATRSTWSIWPNQNRRVIEGNQESKWKAQFLGDKTFRQALSLAINRQQIIDSVYSGIGVPSQIEPGPLSPFHSEKLKNAFIEYDPKRANRMLDGLGLTRRDGEGMRTFPDGSRMSWYMDFTDYTGEGPGQFVVDDWAAVGIRAIQRERSRPLFNSEKSALLHDFTVWSGESEYNPMTEPRSFVAANSESHFAPSYGRWFNKGGLYGNPAALHGGIEPPVGSPIRRTQELMEQALRSSSLEERKGFFREIFDIAADQVFSISIATPPPALVVVKDGFRNVPKVSIVGANYSTPAMAGIETYYWEQSNDSPGAVAQIKYQMTNVTRAPDSVDPKTMKRAKDNSLSGLISKLLLGIMTLTIILAGVRHPYVGRRMLIMVPTLLLISFATFFIIQLPPGDYISTRVLDLQLNGDENAIAEVERLSEVFHTDDPFLTKYARWMGFRWFFTFQEVDKGLLQGEMGRSMETVRSVNAMVGDRVLLTFLVSLGTILFTWAIALPIGIYSAVRQYTVGDYVMTFIGFIGMCVPNFLLAILLMFLSSRYFGINVSGLFSPEYATMPEWNWAKVVDLLKHIWLPIVVIATSSTAGMIRVMRGNLLDELRKPYVTTAMAKGVRPFRLLMKYPVRLALNPFISGIGGVFPQLISGGAIVAIVLSLPMVGPLLLQGLMSEDVYLAGSMLMVLSLLGIFGTLVSDLLLLWLDPRIRMEGGSR
jgi:ABC-type dipeptide/oligopeptide/nickel transport system permease component/ABC-type transport system substrate-binding protein